MVTVNSSPDAASASLGDRFSTVRELTEALCDTLQTEDYVVQSMPDASPTKWHLAHTTWFFETFILEPNRPGYVSWDPRFRVIFNSYYNSVGKKHCRPLRGTLSRPTVAETYAYRNAIDERMAQWLADGIPPEIEPLVELGLHHEQQHQELMLTDLKHMFSMNPLGPVYRERPIVSANLVSPLGWHRYDEGIRCIGFDGPGFSFDNEGPRHQEFVPAFALGSRLVTNGEYAEFIAAGGYDTPTLWLSDGWNARQAQGWQAPFYWQLADDGGWDNFTLSGVRPVAPDEPVTHISYYEADAFAHWAGARLAGEAEWEVAASASKIAGNFVDNGVYHPSPAQQRAADGPAQLYGDVWEWTRSAYLPYHGYQAAPGALGEYNGKFMCNQFVLRGGSCATSLSHVRPTYRNFFPPDARWQFSGIRLAKDA